MTIVNTVDVHVLDDLLDNDECNLLINEIDKLKTTQAIINSSYLSELLWCMIGSKLDRFNFIGFKDSITVTKTKFSYGKHIDEQHAGEKYKLLIYLNDSVGTNFYLNEVMEIEGKVGRGVLFDISLKHGSQKITDGKVKYVIGVRPITVN